MHGQGTGAGPRTGEPPVQVFQRLTALIGAPVDIAPCLPTLLRYDSPDLLVRTLCRYDSPDLLQQCRYDAPEVLVGEPPTPAADVWSFGCVLGEMLTGIDGGGGCAGPQDPQS
eukprot:366433-Chlamydomonas_euryale.AAC.19